MVTPAHARAVVTRICARRRHRPAGRCAGLQARGGDADLQVDALGGGIGLRAQRRSGGVLGFCFFYFFAPINGGGQISASENASLTEVPVRRRM